jgi:hypothetical protein
VKPFPVFLIVRSGKRAGGSIYYVASWHTQGTASSEVYKSSKRHTERDALCLAHLWLDKHPEYVRTSTPKGT